MRIIRYPAEVIQVGCNSFQHADHPRPVETNKLCLDISRHLHRAEDSQLRFRRAPVAAASQGDFRRDLCPTRTRAPLIYCPKMKFIRRSATVDAPALAISQMFFFSRRTSNALGTSDAPAVVFDW